MIYAGEYYPGYPDESRFTLVLREGECEMKEAEAIGLAMRGHWVHEIMIPESQAEKGYAISKLFRGMWVGAIMRGKITTYK